MVDQVDEVKCVVIGDGMVGKTCMLSTFANNSFPQDYIPTVFDNFNTNVMVDGRAASLGLWDTAGQDTYDRLRPLVYPHTNVFMVIFAVDNLTSLRNVREKWVPEIRHHCPLTPLVLVGNKLDLREELKCSPEEINDKGFITKSQGMRFGREIGAAGFGECSALTQTGLKEVFDIVVRIARKPPPVAKPKTTYKSFLKCILL